MNEEPSRAFLRRIVRRAMALAPLLAVAAALALWAPAGASAAPPVIRPSSLIAPAVHIVTLPGSLHPSAKPKNDVGRMDPATHLTGMSLLFQTSPGQKVLRKRALAALEDPALARYHRWFTPEEYAAQFGASPADIARATAWLSSQELSVDGPSRTGTRVAFSATVAQIERAFQTEMHNYRVGGATYFAMSRAPSVPTELADLILGLHGLHDFRVKAPPHKVRPQYALPITGADGGAAEFPVLAPADFAKIYDLDSLYAANISGTGQSITVAEQSDFNDADIEAFRSDFSLPPNPPVRILVPNSGSAAVTGPDDLGEAELDLEWAGAVAPEASVQSVFTGDAPNSDVIDALNYAIEQRTAPVVSISFGKCEDWFTPADASFEEGYGETASLEGMTVVVAAGDTGAAGCDSQSTLAASYGKAVIFPASLPNFVAVGGSQFQLTASNQATYLDTQLDSLSYIPESGWNETLGDIDAGFGGLGAGGGGASRLFAKPYWQIPQTPNDSSRDLPDVALSASADILPYAVSISWTASDGDAQAPQPQALTAFGGTSASAPSFAGILALVNQAIAETNPDAPIGLGNANPMLYALAGTRGSVSAFHDITIGGNVVPCEQGSLDCPTQPPYQFGYAAGLGYDQVTGLGSIDAANLVAAWEALTPTSTALSITASGTAEGSLLHLTASVASKATANSMTGVVTFYFVAPGDGGIGLSGTLGASQVVPSTSSGTEAGVVTLSASAPGGLDGAGVKVGAFYGGDPNYLASWSPVSSIGAASSLTICPTAVTLAAGQTRQTFTTTGGSPPIRWDIHRDSTCARDNDRIVCSTIDAGVFGAGPTAGSATVVAIDEYDSFATAEVTIVDALADAASPPLPGASCTPGEDLDASTDAPTAAATSDASHAEDAPFASDAQAGDAPSESSGSTGRGCGCVMARAGKNESLWEWVPCGLILFSAVIRRTRLGALRGAFSTRCGSFTCRVGRRACFDSKGRARCSANSDDRRRTLPCG